jgi:RHS repeat-associated protein
MTQTIRLGSDQYDADGNTINSLGTANAYDFENHMIAHGGVAIVYDGDGNRVSETVGTVTTNYLVDAVNPTGYAQVVDELQGGNVTRTYSYGLERISETQTISGTLTTSFYGYDGHGSVRQLTNSAGVVTDSYDYDAFGNLINSTGSTPNNYLFAGEAYDPALGLYYNRARYLNTTTGRFWSMDSYEGDSQQPLSLHKYLYGDGDPVDNVDHCGYCLLSNAAWGKIIQQDIFEQYFAFTNGQGLNSPTIASLVAPSAAGYSGGLMPDLASKNPYWGEFYEIKSIYSLAAAETKIATYEYYLNEYDKYRVWIPGLTFEPNLYTPIDDHTLAVVMNTGPGSISYCVISTNELVGFAVVLLAIATLAEAGGRVPDPLPQPAPAFASTTILQAAAAEMDIDVVGAYFY